MPKSYDYDSFVAKFNQNAPKTTDDCYTPENVYEALLDYVGSEVTPLDGLHIRRPFYPGGNFEAEVETYGPQDIVIDNPPFSILAHVLDVYIARGVRFLLFTPSKTSSCVLRRGLTVIIGYHIFFTNGAWLPISFATNLLPNVVVRTAPTLVEAIEACNKANRKEAKKDKKQVRTLAYPRNLTSVMLLNKLKAVPLEIKSAECRFTALKEVYGGGLLITDDAANRIAKAEAEAEAEAKAKAEAVALTLTPAQEAIVAGLNAAAL